MSGTVSILLSAKSVGTELARNYRGDLESACRLDADLELPSFEFEYVGSGSQHRRGNKRRRNQDGDGGDESTTAVTATTTTTASGEKKDDPNNDEEKGSKEKRKDDNDNDGSNEKQPQQQQQQQMSARGNWRCTCKFVYMGKLHVVEATHLKKKSAQAEACAVALERYIDLRAQIGEAPLLPSGGGASRRKRQREQQKQQSGSAKNDDDGNEEGPQEEEDDDEEEEMIRQRKAAAAAAEQQQRARIEATADWPQRRLLLDRAHELYAWTCNQDTIEDVDPINVPQEIVIAYTLYTAAERPSGLIACTSVLTDRDLCVYIFVWEEEQEAWLSMCSRIDPKCVLINCCTSGAQRPTFDQREQIMRAQINLFCTERLDFWKELSAARPLSDTEAKPANVFAVLACTRDLESGAQLLVLDGLAEWLVECNVTAVALSDTDMFRNTMHARMVPAGRLVSQSGAVRTNNNLGMAVQPNALPSHTGVAADPATATSAADKWKRRKTDPVAAAAAAGAYALGPVVSAPPVAFNKESGPAVAAADVLSYGGGEDSTGAAVPVIRVRNREELEAMENSLRAKAIERRGLVAIRVPSLFYRMTDHRRSLHDVMASQVQGMPTRSSSLHTVVKALAHLPTPRHTTRMLRTSEEAAALPKCLDSTGVFRYGEMPDELPSLPVVDAPLVLTYAQLQLIRHDSMSEEVYNQWKELNQDWQTYIDEYAEFEAEGLTNHQEVTIRIIPPQLRRQQQQQQQQQQQREVQEEQDGGGDGNDGDDQSKQKQKNKKKKKKRGPRVREVKVVFYQVRWRGRKTLSWEPESVIDYIAPKMLDAYKRLTSGDEVKATNRHDNKKVHVAKLKMDESNDPVIVLAEDEEDEDDAAAFKQRLSEAQATLQARREKWRANHSPLEVKKEDEANEEETKTTTDEEYEWPPHLQNVCVVKRLPEDDMNELLAVFTERDINEPFSWEKFYGYQRQDNDSGSSGSSSSSKKRKRTDGGDDNGADETKADGGDDEKTTQQKGKNDNKRQNRRNGRRAASAKPRPVLTHHAIHFQVIGQGRKVIAPVQHTADSGAEATRVAEQELRLRLLADRRREMLSQLEALDAAISETNKQADIDGGGDETKLQIRI